MFEQIIIMIGFYSSVDEGDWDVVAEEGKDRRSDRRDGNLST
jgi:hypothetical protein